MDGSLIGLVAVILIFGVPPAAMYTFYRVRKLRTDERLAALARGVNVPMEPELNEGARSRRWGIFCRRRRLDTWHAARCLGGLSRMRGRRLRLE